jgi:hypothetical protein
VHCLSDPPDLSTADMRVMADGTIVETDGSAVYVLNRLTGRRSLTVCIPDESEDGMSISIRADDAEGVASS